MRLSGISCLSIIASAGILACSAAGTALIQPGQQGGGDTAAGGNAAGGNAAGGNAAGGNAAGGNAAGGNAAGGDAAGGMESTGGAFTNGGTPSQGGNPSTGGKQATGGSIATGGKNAGTGGSIVATGGGANPTGGAPGGPTGGGGPVTGGTPATGGMASTGGTTVTVNCTDTPPPNGDTCAHAVLYNWCGANWMNGTCAKSCNMCGATGATGGAPPTGGAPGNGGNAPTGGNGPTGGNSPTGGSYNNGTTLPNVTNGQQAWASRYWDCCKPACGWTGNSSNPISSCSQSNQQLSDMSATNACQSGGSAYMCWSGIPRSVSDSVSYGFAAASGTNYSCGKCFQIQFDGGSNNGSPNAGTTAIKGKQMIIQIINNGGVQANQFDLLIPGGGVGALNACSTQWGTSDLGAQYGGFLSGCNGDASCVQTKCNTVFAGKTDLLAGCSWFLNWFHAADNPTFVYQPVNCPSDFKSTMGGL